MIFRLKDEDEYYGSESDSDLLTLLSIAMREGFRESIDKLITMRLIRENEDGSLNKTSHIEDLKIAIEEDPLLLEWISANSDVFPKNIKLVPYDKHLFKVDQIKIFTDQSSLRYYIIGVRPSVAPKPVALLFSMGCCGHYDPGCDCYSLLGWKRQGDIEYTTPFIQLKHKRVAYTGHWNDRKDEYDEMYYTWLEQGCPDVRDKQHWLSSLQQVGGVSRKKYNIPYGNIVRWIPERKNESEPISSS